MSILSTVGLSKYFGSLCALNKLDIDVEKGRIHGLIGPNGSGKTTFFNVVSNLLPASEGKTYLEGRDITNLSPHIITKLGIARRLLTIVYRILSQQRLYQRTRRVKRSVAPVVLITP